MLHIQTIQSLDEPGLELYRTLRRHEAHERAGVFVATNAKVVQRLLTTRFPIFSALLTPEWLARLEPLLRERPEEIQIYLGERRLIEQISGFHVHQGAFAAARIPSPPTFDELLATSPRPWLFAAMENISSSENLGAIIRNCGAFGVHALITGETCCSPWLRRSVSSSMGAIFSQPLLRSDNLVRTLGALRARGVRCFAAHPQPESKAIATADLRGDCCIVFGTEGAGLSREVLDACDEALIIPMRRDVDSLNVASATAVFLHEAVRQRG